MIELCPELDKLRNKELSFGCRLLAKGKRPIKGIYIRHRGDYLHYIVLEKGGDDDMENNHWYNFSTNEDNYTIIGHPLTRGRIEHCYRNNYPINKPVHKYITVHTQICRWFESNRETAYNQSELERMEHEKRQELKELLIQFSNYL